MNEEVSYERKIKKTLRFSGDTFEDRFVDQSLYEAYARLLEEGIFLCSIRTIYRILAAENEVRERRDQLRHPQYAKPELLAAGPNQIWSQNLTHIALCPIFVYLFAIIDVYSRKFIGWHLGFNARVESMKKAWDNALANEDLIGIANSHQMPTALSDHGVQMAKKNAKEFFKELGIK